MLAEVESPMCATDAHEERSGAVRAAVPVTTRPGRGCAVRVSAPPVTTPPTAAAMATSTTRAAATTAGALDSGRLAWRTWPPADSEEGETQ